MARPDPDAPPACPPGQVTGPPDVVGVGVQKAGTTWWWQLLAHHPRFHANPAFHKELHYFDRFWATPFDPERHVPGYHAWFPRPPGAVTGEWTPRYLHDWWVPPLLAASAPAARVLVVLRHPVERFRSGIAHELRSRGRVDPAIAGDALRRSCYAEQLRGLARHVPAERTLVLQYERCVAHPLAELRRTQRFLGLEEHEPPAELVAARVNATEGPLPQLPPWLAEELAARLAADRAQLADLVPDLDLDRWS